MPLIVLGPDRNIRWTSGRGEEIAASFTAAGPVTLALVNNMPDLALGDTEAQYFELLSAAAGDVPVLLRLFSLPEIARSERIQKHIADTYETLPALLANRVDGLIITGTEPQQSDLRKEPYWSTLSEVLSWAEQNTSSTILSCLAAHAGVLHSEGIARHPLGEKRCGVFEFEIGREHWLTGAAGARWSSPHSRWNEVRAPALAACGYSILAHTPEAGVDLFVRQRGGSLFIHFQGHPEYDRLALYKEYRRDVRRFLKRERTSYPLLPHGYFDEAAATALQSFEQQALAWRDEQMMDRFPEQLAMATLENTWRARAVGVYRRWIEHAAASRPQFRPVLVAGTLAPQPLAFDALRMEADALASN